MAERQTRTVVGYDVDRASIQKVVVGNQAIRNSIEGVRDVLGDLGASTASGVNMLNTRFDLLGRNIQDDLRIVEDLHQELRDLDNVVVEPEVRVQQTNTGSAARRNSSGIETTDRLASIGSQIFSGLGQGELANAAGLVGDIAGATSALGPLGIAAAVLAPVIGLVTSEINKNIQKEQERIDILKQVSALIVTGTRDEVQTRIESLQQDIVVQEAWIQAIEKRTGRDADYLAQLNDVDISNASALQSGLQLIDLFGNNLVSAANNVDKANTAIEDNQFFIDALTEALNENATATNDAVAAESALADQHQRNIDERLAREAAAARREVQTAEQRVQIDGMTEDARQARVAAVQREIEVLTSVRDSTTTSWQAAEELSKKIYALTSEMMLLSETAETTADQAARVAAQQKALSDQTDNYFDAITAEVSAQEKAFTARQEYAQAVAEGAAKEQALATETADKRAEILTDSRDRLTEIEERGAKDRAKILRDFSRTYTQAVGERDALAGKNAKIAAADRLADQQEGYDEQLRTQNKALEKQIKALDKSYNDQYARLVQGINAEIATRQMAINRAVVDLTNAENYKANIAMYGAGTQRSIHEYMWGQINQTAVAWASNTVNSVRGIMGAYTGSYATQYPMSVGGQQPVTLNYNVTGTQNAITTTTFRNLLQAASTRSGAGSAYQ